MSALPTEEYCDLCLEQKDMGFVLRYRVKARNNFRMSTYEDEYSYSYKEEAYGEKQLSQALAKFEKLAGSKTAK